MSAHPGSACGEAGNYDGGMEQQVLSYARGGRRAVKTAAVVVLWLWAIGSGVAGIFLGGFATLSFSMATSEGVGLGVCALILSFIAVGLLLLGWGIGCGWLAIQLHRRKVGAEWRAVDAMERAMWAAMLGNGLMLAVIAGGTR